MVSSVFALSSGRNAAIRHSWALHPPAKVQSCRYPCCVLLTIWHRVQDFSFRTSNFAVRGNFSSLQRSTGNWTRWTSYNWISRFHDNIQWCINETRGKRPRDSSSSKLCNREKSQSIYRMYVKSVAQRQFDGVQPKHGRTSCVVYLDEMPNEKSTSY